MSTKKSSKKNKQENKTPIAKSQTTFLYTKENYYIMLAGLALIVLGFLAMTGAKVTDPEVFDYSEIYSFRRVTLAPILIILGFVVEIYAIMRKPKSAPEE